ncbi:hypothetical protein ACPDHL_12290 [Myroides sp. C15-4]|uniref:hypothetical protein n=1 Tax=Myroides sp. C15-4 TaxID=3400532 RepID=UPI003D2F801B
MINKIKNKTLSFISRNPGRIFWAAIILLIVFLIFYIKILDQKIASAITVALLTIYIGMIKQNYDDDKLFLELFNHFNSRYDTKLNKLFNDLRLNDGKEINQKDILLIIDYFNLCSEEYLWYKNKRLPPEIWRAWEYGIIANINLRQVKKIFENENQNENSRKSYYGFMEYIADKL